MKGIKLLLGLGILIALVAIAGVVFGLGWLEIGGLIAGLLIATCVWLVTKGIKFFLGMGILYILIAIASVVFGQSTYIEGALHATVGTVFVFIYLAHTTKKRVFEIALLGLCVLFYILFFHLLGWL